MEKWNQIDLLRGYLVQGSNGEYCYLTPNERIEMIEKVCQWSKKEKLVLAGSGMESTQGITHKPCGQTFGHWAKISRKFSLAEIWEKLLNLKIVHK